MRRFAPRCDSFPVESGTDMKSPTYFRGYIEGDGSKFQGNVPRSVMKLLNVAESVNTWNERKQALAAAKTVALNARTRLGLQELEPEPEVSPEDAAAQVRLATCDSTCCFRVANFTPC